MSQRTVVMRELVVSAQKRPVLGTEIQVPLGWVFVSRTRLHVVVYTWS